MMEEERIQETKDREESVKSPWQVQKECWYSQVPLTVKQLDLIIGVCIGLLILVFALIILQAAHIL